MAFAPGSIALRVVEKARALFNDDRPALIEPRLKRLVARRKVQARASALDRLSNPAAEEAAAPLYEQSVYGSLAVPVYEGGDLHERA